MTEKPSFGVVSKGTLYSKAIKRADVLEDYLTIFALMLDERAKKETTSNGVLIQTNATNGYVKIGWRAMEITDTSEPDYEWDLAPYFIWFPDLFDKGDADDFERPLKSAARAMARMFSAHWRNNHESTGTRRLAMDKLTTKPSKTLFDVPTDTVFKVYMMNELDYFIRVIRK